MRPGDEQVPGTPCGYGDWVMDGLLSDLLPAVENGVRVDRYFRLTRIFAFTSQETSKEAR